MKYLENFKLCRNFVSSENKKVSRKTKHYGRTYKI